MKVLIIHEATRATWRNISLAQEILLIVNACVPCGIFSRCFGHSACDQQKDFHFKTTCMLLFENSVASCSRLRHAAGCALPVLL